MQEFLEIKQRKDETMKDYVFRYENLKVEADMKFKNKLQGLYLLKNFENNGLSCNKTKKKRKRKKSEEKERD